MKIYKVTKTTEIVNYKPVNEDIYSKYYQSLFSSYHREVNSEQLFLSEEKASKVYGEALLEIKNKADEEINRSNLTYYVNNVWDNGGYPYKIISCVDMKEIEVEDEIPTVINNYTISGNSSLSQEDLAKIVNHASDIATKVLKKYGYQ